MNQMLSNVCIIHIYLMIVTLPIFLLTFSIESIPNSLCTLFSCHGRFWFTSSLSQLTLRQVIRFVYRVNWKFMSNINDDFAALFLLIWTLLGCAIFNVVDYFFGNNNTDMNYHYCTGRCHTKNIQNEIKFLESIGNMNSKSALFKNIVTPGPIDYFTYVAVFILVLVSFLSWIANHKHQLKSLWKKCFFCRSLFYPGSPVNNQLLNQNNQEQSKLFDLNAGQIIRIIVVALFCSFPAIVMRVFAHRSENNVNSGLGRVWVYINQISFAFLFINVFPAQIILSNSKMLKSLRRDFKESTIGEKIWSVFKRN